MAPPHGERPKVHKAKCTLKKPDLVFFLPPTLQSKENPDECEKCNFNNKKEIF